MVPPSLSERGIRCCSSYWGTHSVEHGRAFEQAAEIFSNVRIAHSALLAYSGNEKCSQSDQADEASDPKINSDGNRVVVPGFAIVAGVAIAAADVGEQPGPK